MDRVAAAFAFLGWIVNLNGRRLQRAYEASRVRTITPLTGSPMLTAHTAPRALRRKLCREINMPFRPIVGYRGLSAPDHKEVIAAMKSMK